MIVHYSTELDVTAEEAWQLASDQFGETGEWSSGLTSSYLDASEMALGVTRVCHSQDTVLAERITKFDPDNRAFTYELVEPPSGVDAVTNSWTVTSLEGERSMLSMTLDLRLSWFMLPFGPIMPTLNRLILRRAQSEFKHYVETGTPHARKQAHSAKHTFWRTPEKRAPRAV